MFSPVTFAEKLATLPDIFKPYFLSVDDQQFYVAEGTTVYIFSLQDFALKKKFGKPGQGPQEFALVPRSTGSLTIYPQTDSILINSPGKVSFFTKDGEFSKEMKSTAGLMGGFFQPIGDQFAGMSFLMGQDQSMTITINIYDAKLTKIKEIYKQPFLKRGRMEFPMVSAIFYVSNNKIITPGGQKEFAINILDDKGTQLSSITREYKQLKVTEDYKKGVFDFFKTNPDTKPYYEVLKNMIKFSDYFPPIQIFYVDNQKIYIQTFLKKDETDEFFIYNFKGQFLKRLFLPVAYMDGIRPCPTYIKKNKLYQVIENEEEEVWELHAHTIE
jgi:hypothetical protein